MSGTRSSPRGAGRHRGDPVRLPARTFFESSTPASKREPERFQRAVHLQSGESLVQRAMKRRSRFFQQESRSFSPSRRWRFVMCFQRGDCGGGSRFLWGQSRAFLDRVLRYSSFTAHCNWTDQLSSAVDGLFPTSLRTRRVARREAAGDHRFTFRRTRRSSCRLLSCSSQNPSIVP